MSYSLNNLLKGSVSGRASDFHSEGCEFETRRWLQTTKQTYPQSIHRIHKITFKRAYKTTLGLAKMSRLLNVHFSSPFK